MYSFRLFEFREVVDQYQADGPYGRSGHRLVIDKDCKLYMLGGYSQNITYNRRDRSHVIPTDNSFLFTELWSFNLLTNTWEFHDEISLSLPNSICASPAIIMPFSNNILVYGGTGSPFGEDILSVLLLISMKTKTVQIVPDDITTPIPYPVYGSAIFFNDNYLYTIGGTNGTLFTMDIHRYNILTTEWELIFENNSDNVEPPTARYRHEVVFDGKDRIYVFGGVNNNNVFHFAVLPVFNLQTRKWEKKKTIGDPSMQFPFPRCRKFNSCVHFKNEIGDIIVYIFAGCRGNNIVLSDLWKLNLTTFQWTKINYTSKTSINGAFFHSAAVTSYGKMYVFGGVSGEHPNLRRVSDFHTIWLQIPKLSEICWEALQFYIPKSLFVPSMNNLFRKFGVPEKFLSRL